GTDVKKNILKAWSLLFAGIANVNGWPAKNTFNNAFFGMYVYPHRGGNLVITAAVPAHIDVSFSGDVMNKPADLVSMRLYGHFKGGLRVNDPNSGPICVHQ